MIDYIPLAGRKGKRVVPSRLLWLRVRLSLAFALFLLLVVGVGLFSLNRLSNFHGVAAQISERWLQTNSILGDLNNDISDFRASEGELLIARSRDDLRAAEQEIIVLDDAISQAEAHYARVRHVDSELALHNQFTVQWAEYRKLASRVIALAQGNQLDAAVSLYYHESRKAFNLANGTLAVMTARNADGMNDAVAHETIAYRNARLLIIAAIVVACCLLVAAVAYLVHSVSNPMASLVECMHRIADNDTDVIIAGDARRDEIGDIARAVVRFRDNTIELARSKQALEHNALVLQDTLDKERRMADLQRNFVSMASHEFRTPLNIIDGHAQRLLRKRDALTADAVEERCGKIRAAVQRMTGLIDHLLESTQALDEALPSAIRVTEFSLPMLLHEVCEMHRDSTPSATIRERIDAGVPELFRGDAKLLFQAFSNLIGNAIKYSRPGALVRLSATLSGDSRAVEVAVADEGIGIPERDREHLFERYIRGGNVAGTAGAGVGLYVVKLAVELHGGSVRLESQEGRGSRFTVWLPLAFDTHNTMPRVAA